jgi:hypothetical protein
MTGPSRQPPRAAGFAAIGGRVYDGGEARLAAALRLNLKRRKAAAKGETGTPEPPATDPKPAPPDRR